MNEEKFKIAKKLITVGGSSRYVIFPPEVLAHIGIENGEDCEVWLMPDCNTKGQKYVAVFKRECASDHAKK